MRVAELRAVAFVEDEDDPEAGMMTSPVLLRRRASVGTEVRETTEKICSPYVV